MAKGNALKTILENGLCVKCWGGVKRKKLNKFKKFQLSS